MWSQISVVLIGTVVASVAPPPPPGGLGPWVEYAEQIYDQDPKCPPKGGCLQLSRLELEGRIDSGHIKLVTHGINLGARRQQGAWLKPAGVFSVTSVRFLRGGAAVQEEPQEISIRASRDFLYGSVTTFTYAYTVSGLKEQGRVSFVSSPSELPGANNALLWAAYLAGDPTAPTSLPAPWAVTAPLLFVRLLWAVWVVGLGVFCFREGKRALQYLLRYWHTATMPAAPAAPVAAAKA